jgi:penicillin-binding protein 1A
MYFNTVDFGSNSFGIKTAAKTFFDKTPTDLTVNEAAMLVGLLKAPTAYSPVLHPEAALNRRNASR